jgi:hypothetical protein
VPDDPPLVGASAVLLDEEETGLSAVFEADGSDVFVASPV